MQAEQVMQLLLCSNSSNFRGLLEPLLADPVPAHGPEKKGDNCPIPAEPQKLFLLLPTADFIINLFFFFFNGKTMNSKNACEDWEVAKGRGVGTCTEAAGLGAGWWDGEEGNTALATGCCSFPSASPSLCTPHHRAFGEGAGGREPEREAQMQLSESLKTP